MTQPLLIALTFDIEADAFDQSLQPGSVGKINEELHFQGVHHGVPVLKNYLRELRDSFDQRACATWYVRCDDQVEWQTGQADFLLSHYSHWWESFIEEGDEIGFHTHLYELADDRWQQMKDDARICDQLSRSYQYFSKSGVDVNTSRIGESYFSGPILKQLKQLGMVADTTAMPGRTRKDDQRCIDWAGTPYTVYWPDIHDYRIPGCSQSVDSLLQIPFSMMCTRTDYDDAPLNRYLDLSFHEHIFQPVPGETIQSMDLLVAVTHPSTILPELDKGGHGLVSFSMQTFVNNLESVLLACRKQSRPYRFVTPGQAVSEGLIVEGMRTGTVGRPADSARTA